MDQRALYQAPYGWLMRLPGFDGLRVPARFWMMALAVPERRRRRSPSTGSPGARAADRRRRSPSPGCCSTDGRARSRCSRRRPLRPSPSGVDAAPRSADRRRHRRAGALPADVRSGPARTTASAATARRTTTRCGRCWRSSDPRILPRARRARTARRRRSITRRCRRRDAQVRAGRARRDASSAWSATGAAIACPQSRRSAGYPGRDGRAAPHQVARARSQARRTPRARWTAICDTRWSGGVQEQSAEATIELEQPRRTSGRSSSISAGSSTDFPSAAADRRLGGRRRPGSTAWTGDTALHAYFGALRHPREVPLVLPIEPGRRAVHPAASDRIRHARLEHRRAARAPVAADGGQSAG